MYVIWDPESPRAGSASKAPWTNHVEFSCRCNDSGILKLLQDPQEKLHPLRHVNFSCVVHVIWNPEAPARSMTSKAQWTNVEFN
jgi:hypothetical protein